jgi:hypothetical protein
MTVVADSADKHLVQPVTGLKKLWNSFLPRSPLHPDNWRGRLKPSTLRRLDPEDIPQCLELYRLNEPGRFPAGSYQQQYLDSLTSDTTTWSRSQRGG